MRIDLIGVPCGLGGAQPGTAHGPAAVRAAGLVERLRGLGLSVEDLGDARPPAHQTDSNKTPTTDTDSSESVQDCLELGSGVMGAESVGAWCARARRRVEQSVGLGHLPVTLGGDHSISAGSMAGVARACRTEGLPVPGLLWIDAHVDCNTTETSPSGNLHGMPLAALFGMEDTKLTSIVGAEGQFDPQRVACIGARAIDPGEARHLREYDIACFETKTVLNLGVGAVVAEAMARISPRGEPICVSFDIDVVDPAIAPGVDTAVPGGLSPEEVIACLELVGQHAPIVAIDLVELNPVNDDHGKTARIMVDCAEALLRSVQDRTRTLGRDI